MKFTIFCDVVVKDEGQATQMAGCGVAIIAEEGARSKKRSYSFGLGGSDTELSNIQVVRLALASVLPPFRKSEVLLHVTDRRAIDLLARSGADYSITPDKYQVEIAELRKWYKYYSNITFILDASADKNIIEAHGLATAACQTQKNTDSNTIDIS